MVVNNLSDPNVGRNQLLYPIEDADKAWNNTLLDSGYNVYKANPFVQSLQRAGRGLRTTFLQDQAFGNAQGAANPNPAEQFGSYLKNTLGSGNVYATLNQGAAQMRNTVNNVRNYQQQLASGQQTAETANPYLALLADELSAGNGQGTATALTQLRAPLLGSRLGSSYNSMLNDIVAQANRSLANDPATYNPGSPRDIWSYIFGTAGSPF